MLLYASQTHGKTNLKALRLNGFRLLATPDTWRNKPPTWDNNNLAPFALDNGAYGCFLRKEPFRSAEFNAMVEQLGRFADWVIAPDIVGGGLASLQKSLTWRHSYNQSKVLLAAQDGISPNDLAPHLDEETGIAVGGSTRFKIETLPLWSRLAAFKNCYLHVLRVNTRQRLAACSVAKADSIDGTSATMYSKNAPVLRRWVDELNRQPTLEVWR